MSIKRIAIAAIFATGLALSGHPSCAAAPMLTGALVPPPGGFIGFCTRHLPDCTRASTGAAVVELTSERRQQLESVQNHVNLAVVWRNDPQHLWDYPKNGYGDCSKFALEKRRELLALGWPSSALLLTTATTETDEAHLVLVVRSSEGDLVLDNRFAGVHDWTRYPYRWGEQQSPANPTLWVGVLPAGFTTADAGSPIAVR
jgi:predicted transglutaminase-like cysteine proteinase